MAFDIKIDDYYVVDHDDKLMVVQVVDKKDDKFIVVDVISGDFYTMPPLIPMRTVNKVEKMLLDAFSTSEYYSKKRESIEIDPNVERLWERLFKNANCFINMHMRLINCTNVLETKQDLESFKNIIKEAKAFVKTYAPKAYKQYSNILDKYLDVVENSDKESEDVLNDSLESLSDEYDAIFEDLQKELMNNYK